MKKLFFLIIISFVISATTYSQTSTPNRYALQLRFISNDIILPQLKIAPRKINRILQIDSLFSVIQTNWNKAVKDSLSKYKGDLTISEFNNLDAYFYRLTIRSIAFNHDIAPTYWDYLVKNYMAPAMLADYEMVKRLHTSEAIGMIRGSSFDNTLSMALDSGISKETFLKAFTVYSKFDGLCTELTKNKDIAVSNSAKKLLNGIIKDHYYDMNAQNDYYQGEYYKAYNLLITGLSVDKYYKPWAISLAQKLLRELQREGNTDQCFALLNTLMVNTTADNLSRDTLKRWYAAIDPGQGSKMYADINKKLSLSAFKNIGKHINLPLDWTFIINQLPADKIKNAKYLLADFWYTGCGPCLSEIPELNAFYEKIKSRDDVIFISVNTDYVNGKMDKNYVLKRSKELGIKYPVFYDHSAIGLSKQLSIVGYPAKFILSTSGEVLAKTDNSDISLDSFEMFLKEQK